MKRKYVLKKPRPKKPVDEKMVQSFYSVKSKYKKVAEETISSIIKQWK
jgi:hypothetical protein